MRHHRGKSCVNTPAALISVASIGLIAEALLLLAAGGLSEPGSSSPPDADRDMDLMCHA